MVKYYIPANNKRGFEEISKTRFLSLFGDDTTRPYANRVYKGELSIEEVPEELRESVQAVVDAKIAKWGTYESRDIPDGEALNIITGGSAE